MTTPSDTQWFKETDQLSAWRLFLRTYRRVLDQLEDELQEQRGLSLAWYDVLIQLYRSPEHRLRMNDLAGSVLLSKSGLTRLIDRMEKAGYVEKRPCESDARGHVLVVTDAGRALRKKMWPTYLAAIRKHIGSHLSENDARALCSLLVRLIPERDSAAKGKAASYGE